MADLMLDFGSYNKLKITICQMERKHFIPLIWANFALKEKDPLKYFEEKLSIHV